MPLYDTVSNKMEDRRPIHHAPPGQVDVTHLLADMQAAMRNLAGGIVAQSAPLMQSLQLEDLPAWLESTGSNLKSVLDNLPPSVPPPPTSPPPVDDVWSVVLSKKSGKLLAILPKNESAEWWFDSGAEDGSTSEFANTSYDAAVKQCREHVESIIKECIRKNLKFRDTQFSLEDRTLCLLGLLRPPKADGPLFSPPPQSVARLSDVLTKPKLLVDKAKAGDIRQGMGGDCWFLAAIAGSQNLGDGARQNYIKVEGDEKVGCYGFVFHRDGEWVYEIVDDYVYLTNPEYGTLLKPNDSDPTQPNFDDRKNKRGTFESNLLYDMGEEKYRMAFLTGNDALYFSKSRNENETWLPLFEKAFAKAHGDYQAIEGGFMSEAIEDMTGGVSTEIRVGDILDREQIWKEMKESNRDILFGCWTREWPDGAETSQGLLSRHAYAIVRVQEVQAGEPSTLHRLVLVQNTLAQHEWKGPWSDGSKEWNSALMQELDHKFGEDGVFWMSLDDLFRKFEILDRIRLIGPGWICTQRWTSLPISRQIRYHKTKFTFTLDKEDLVIISLSQLDGRYFRGLEGPYKFTLAFRLEKEGEKGVYARSTPCFQTRRSVNTELTLPAGSYSVYLKIEAEPNFTRGPIRDALRFFLARNPRKLVQIGKKYNLAHMKPGIGDKEDRSVEDLGEITAPILEGNVIITDFKARGKQDRRAPKVPKNQVFISHRPDSPPAGDDSSSSSSDESSAAESPDEEERPNDSGPPPPLLPQPPLQPPQPPKPTPRERRRKRDKKRSKPAPRAPPPWSAIATIGLRVFTRVAAVELNVVETSEVGETAESGPVVGAGEGVKKDLNASPEVDGMEAGGGGGNVKNEVVDGEGPVEVVEQVKGEEEACH